MTHVPFCFCLHISLIGKKSPPVMRIGKELEFKSRFHISTLDDVKVSMRCRPKNVWGSKHCLIFPSWPMLFNSVEITELGWQFSTAIAY